MNSEPKKNSTGSCCLCNCCCFYSKPDLYCWQTPPHTQRKLYIAFYNVDFILFKFLLLPLKIKSITLLWQLSHPVKKWLTPSKPKSLDCEANYFLVLSRTHLLSELGCLVKKKQVQTGKSEASIWSNVYTTCYHKGCELNGSEMLWASEI